MGLQNGLYLARTTESPVYSLVLRVDLDPDVGPNGYVSGDLYEGFVHAPDVFDTDGMRVEARFLGSFRSAPFPNGQPGAGPPGLSVPLAAVPPGVGQFTLDIDPIAGSPSWLIRYVSPTFVPGVFASELEFIARRRQAAFHDLLLEVDASAGLPRPTEVTFEWRGRPVSMRDCLDRAGFRLVLGGGSSDLPDAPPDGQAGWTLDQLKTFFLTPAGDHGFRDRQSGLSLAVYQMVVSGLRGQPRTTGAMFQDSGRAWSALFYESLASQFARPGSAAGELDANFLFTAAHEVGHCLNLPHAFEPAAAAFGITPDFATFMNYPHRYHGPPDSPPVAFTGAEGWTVGELDRYQKFWSTFRFAFMPEELLLLRHADRRDLLVPGSVADPSDPAGEFRGEFAANATAAAYGGPDGAGLELCLRVRGRPSRTTGRPPVFEFGELVVVEVRLQNRLKGPRLVDRPLSVLTGDLTLSYRTPAGRFERYRPPAALCTLSTPAVLDGDPRSPDPEAGYNDIYLSAGAGGTVAWEPGRYLVRAAYRLGNTLLVSNVLDLHVRYPDRATEDLILPLVDERVGSYLSFRGVYGLPVADRRLADAFLADDGTLRPDVRHPLANYYAAYEGRLRAAQTVRLEPDTRRPVAAYRPEDADPLRWYLQAFGLGSGRRSSRARRRVSDLATLPFSNITLGKLGRAFHTALLKAGRDELAADLVEGLGNALDARGVPEPVQAQVLPDGHPH